jgi:hypothetical protein
LSPKTISNINKHDSYLGLKCVNIFLRHPVHTHTHTRRAKWKGHAAHMVQRRKVYKIIVGKPKGKRPLGKIMLKWILKKQDVRLWNGFKWLRPGLTDGFL